MALGYSALLNFQWFSPICMICPLAPSSNELFIYGGGRSQNYLVIANLRIRCESPHISCGLGRVSRWRVGATDKITSDICYNGVHVGVLRYFEWT